MVENTVRYTGEPTEPTSLPAVLRKRSALTPGAAEQAAAALASLGTGKGER